MKVCPKGGFPRRKIPSRIAEAKNRNLKSSIVKDGDKAEGGNNLRVRA